MPNCYQGVHFGTYLCHEVPSVTNETEFGMALAADEVNRVLRPSRCRASRSKMETLIAIEELDRRFGIPGVARVCHGRGGLPRIQITTPQVEGEMYFHGAQ